MTKAPVVHAPWSVGHPDDRPNFYTPNEAAARLGVDRRTVARWHAAGKIRAARTPGGMRRYNVVDIEAIREGTHGQ